MNDILSEKKSSMKNRSLKEKEFQHLILVHIKLAIAKRINNSENLILVLQKKISFFF